MTKKRREIRHESLTCAQCGATMTSRHGPAPAHEQITGLVQALEHGADMMDRLSAVLGQFIRAHEDGTSLDPEVIADYRAQLVTVAGQRAQLRQQLHAWWVLLGRERTH